jgi:hypothetical protein
MLQGEVPGGRPADRGAGGGNGNLAPNLLFARQVLCTQGAVDSRKP